MSIHQLELFEASLPEKPYCTDVLGSLLVRPRLTAIKMKYIQHNPVGQALHLVYDVDSPSARFDWYDHDCPPPSWLALNRENGHAHLGYTLQKPVSWYKIQDNAATRYLGAVDVALTKKLNADPGYTKVITKNPLRSDYWWVETFQEEPYTLEWLASWLDLEPYKDQRKRLPAIGYGRNSTLFDRVRFWAYRRIRDGWLSQELWKAAVLGHAIGYNDFDPQLNHSEVRGIARSIAAWTWKNLSSDGFQAWADGRRKKSTTVRKTKAQEKKIQALDLASQGLTQRQIAEKLGLTQARISQYLKPEAVERSDGPGLL